MGKQHKIILSETYLEDMNWVDMIEIRDKWRALLSTVMDIRFI
jgi:hypothetical protein